MKATLDLAADIHEHILLARILADKRINIEAAISKTVILWSLLLREAR